MAKSTWFKKLTDLYFRRSQKASKPRTRRTARLCLEGLEDRTVPATLSFSAGVLTYTAGAGEVNNLVLTHTGSTYTFQETTGVIITANVAGSDPPGNSGSGTSTITCSSATVTSVVINLLDQNDTVRITSNATGDSVTINAGDGSDTIFIGFGDLSTVVAPVTVNGNNDTDTVTIDDNSTSGTDAYTITNSAVTRASFGGLTYGSIEGLTLNAQNGANIINVSSTAAGTPVTLNAGGGDDIINIGLANSITGVAGAVIVSGQGGADDQININDASAGNDTYGVTSSTITRTTTFGGLTYDGTIERITLNAQTGNNTVNISSTAATTPVTVNGNAGDDTINVGAGDLSQLASLVTVDGGAQTASDLVIVNDAGPGTDTYDINTAGPTPNLTRAGFGGLTFTTIEGFTLNAQTGANIINVSNLAIAPNLVPVTINANGGADAINVTASGAGTLITINGGADDDTVTIGSGDLDMILGNVTVNGDAHTGSDIVILNDSADPGTETYTITATTVDRTGAFGLLTYGTLEALTLNAQAGSNVININSTTVSTPITINAGGGDDTINVGAGNLSALAGAIIVNGDTHTAGDSILIDDTATAGTDTYTITSTTVIRTGGFGGLTYATVESLRLDAQSGDNSINVTSTTSTTAVTINAGAGNDAVTLGGGNLGLLTGPVTVNGQSGTTDTLTLNDSGTAGTDSYTMTATTVTRTGGFAGVTYGTVETLNLNAQTGNNIINVIGSASGTSAVLNGNDGDDTFNIGGGNLTNLAGAVTVNGQTGANDQVVIDDSATAGNDSYTITSNLVTRTTGFGGLTYGTVESLILSAQAGNNAINVNSTLAATPVTVNANAGDDTITVGGGDIATYLGSIVTVNAGAHTSGDQVVVNDTTAATAATFDITTTQITRNSAVFMNYSAAEALTVNASGNADIVNIHSTLAGTPVTINGNAGNDTVNLAPTSNDLGQLAGAITVNGGAHAASDVVIANDTASVVVAYNITSTQLNRSGFGGLTYATIEGLTLHAGNPDNIINVASTASATPVTINTGAGNDTINVGSGDLSSLAGNLIIDGQGDTSDQLIIDDSATVADLSFTITNSTVSGTGFTGMINYSNIEGLTLTSGDGDDTILVTSTAGNTPVTVNGTNGDDAITVGGGNVVANLLSAVTVNGNSENTITGDQVIVDDTAAAAGTYTITSTQVTRGVFTFLNYATVEGLTLNAGSNDDIVNVESTLALTPVTVNTNAGNDTVNLAPTSDSLTSLAGRVTVNGGANTTTDTIVISDTSALAAGTFTITSTQVTRSSPAGFGGLDYAAVESVTLNAGSFGDTVTVSSTAAGTPVAINAGGGDDTINIGAGDLGLLLGGVAIDGQAGTNDQVVINDNGTAGTNGYEILATGVTRSGFAGISSYSNVEGLTLNAQNGANDIDITSVADGVALTVNAGGGDDAIDVGTGTALTIAALAIDGQAGADTVNFNNNLTMGSPSGTGNVSVTGETIVVAAGVAIDTTPGTGGSVTFTADRTGGTFGAGAAITMSSGSSVTTDDDAITFLADSIGNGDYTGIDINNANIITTSGAITLTGRGGDDAASGDHYGILVRNGGTIHSAGTGTGTDTIILNGTGGIGIDNGVGVLIWNLGSLITSSGAGNIRITGTGAGGAGNSGDYNIGVLLLSGGQVTSTGSDTAAADIIINGNGGTGTATSVGISVESSAAVISVDGDISITGVGGSGGSFNVGTRVINSGQAIATGDGTITINGTAGTGIDDNYGVEISIASSIVSTNTGTLQITGIGNGTGVNNHGIRLANSGFVETTGSADIVLIGTASTTAGATGNGVRIEAPAAILSDDDGNVTVTGTGVGTTGTQFRPATGEADIEWTGLLTIDKTGGAFTFDGTVRGDILSVPATDPDKDYQVIFTDGGLILDTGLVTFNNTGGVTLNNNALDDLLFNGGVTSTASTTTTAGFIRTSGDNITLGSVTLAQSTTLDTTNASASQGGTIDLQGVVTGATQNFTAIAGRNISVASTSGITTTSGAITLTANQLTPQTGAFIGINVDGATITTTSGAISLTGTGGANAGDGFHYGVRLHNNAVISSTGTGAAVGSISIDGSGGTGTDENYGVLLIDSNTVVSSVDADIQITGQGATLGTGALNVGLRLMGGAEVISTGTGAFAGNITITGDGGTGTTGAHGISIITGSQIRSTGDGAITLLGTAGAGGNDNYGIEVNGAGSLISVHAGLLDITGVGNGSGTGNHGILLTNSGTVQTTANGPITLTGTASTTGGAEGNGVRIDSLAVITSAGSGDVTINGTGTDGSFAPAAGQADIEWDSLAVGPKTGGVFTFSDTVLGATLTVAAGTYSVRLLDGGIITNNVNFQNTVGVTLGNQALDILLLDGGASTSAPTTVGGSVRTSGDVLTLGNVTLAANSTLDTTNNGGSSAGAALGVGSITGAGFTLGLNSGTGGAITATGAVDNVSTLTIVNSNGATFQGSVGQGTAGIVTLTDTENGQTIAFQANTHITTLTTTANGYAVSFTGSSNQVDNAATFANTGGVTLGDQTTDVILFGGGLTSTASTTTTAGFVRTSGDNMTLGAVTVAQNTTLDTTNAGTAQGGTINFTGAVTGTTRNFTATAGRNIVVQAASGITTTSGNITLNANQLMAQTGNFAGIDLLANVSSTSGTISMTGRGGSTADFNVGIVVQTGVSVSSSTGAITLHGTGGTGVNDNDGIDILGAVTSVDGNISITGVGDGSGDLNFGVWIDSSGLVESTGLATITIGGQGSAAGDDQSTGIEVGGAVRSDIGDIQLTGTGSGSGFFAHGVLITGLVTTLNASSTADISITGTAGGILANGIRIDVTGSIASPGTGNVTLTGAGTDTSMRPASGEADIEWFDLTIAKASGTWTFNSTVLGTGTFTVNAGTGPYAVVFNDGGSITDTDDVDFDNTGGVYFGDDAGDDLLFESGVTSTASTTTTAGAVRTSGDLLTLGTFTATAATTLDTTDSGGTPTGAAINIGTGTLTSNNLTLASGTGGTINFNGVVTSTSGAVAATGRNMVMNAGTGITTGSGNVTMNANAAAATGNFHGIYINGASAAITTTSGAISLTARGGTTDGNRGVYLNAGGRVQSLGAGTIGINGTGGAGVNNNEGVVVEGAASLITSLNGNIQITGTGGGNGTGNQQQGVAVLQGKITSTGAATITIDGTGGAGLDNLEGVLLSGSGSQVTSTSGNIQITGDGGSSAGNDHQGIRLLTGATVTSTGSATITISGTGGTGGLGTAGVAIEGAGAAVSANNVAIFITGSTLAVAGNGVRLTGGGTVNAPAFGTVIIAGTGTGTATGEADIEWDNLAIAMAGGTWQFDGTVLGTSSFTTAAGAYALVFNDGGDINGAVTFNNTGGVHVNAGNTLASPGILNLDGVAFASSSVTWNVTIDGTSGVGAVGGHDQFAITGTVNLASATLSLHGAHVPNPNSQHEFVIISNDNTDLVTGTFNNLPEGSPILFNGQTLYITYQGGDGNDVALLHQPVVNGTSGDDHLILRRNAGNTQFQFSLNGAAFIDIGNPVSFTFNGLAGDDIMTVDYSIGDPIPGAGGSGEGITFNGGTQTSSDMLRIKGTGTQTLNSTPSATTVGAGSISVTGSGTISYSGLEPIDIVNVSAFTLTLPNSNDVVALADGTTFYNRPADPIDPQGALNALRISGSSGGINFETHALRNITTVVIAADTNDAGSPNDTVTINSASSTHGIANLTIDTGTGNDTVTVAGAVSLTGAFDADGTTIAVNSSINAGIVTLTADESITTNAGSSISASGAVTMNAISGGGSGNFTVGINIAGSVTSTAAAVSLTGRGGNDLPTSSHDGIRVQSTGSVSALGSITLVGTGGTGAADNAGVRIEGSVTATGTGNIVVTGTGTAGNGVRIVAPGAISSASSGNVTINGTGTGTTTGLADIEFDALTITKSGGSWTFRDTVLGTGNFTANAGNYSLFFNDGGTISGTTAFNNGQPLVQSGLSVNAGAVANTPGRLDVGPVTFGSSNTWNINLNGPTQTTDFDFMNVTGLATLGGALAVSNGAFTSTIGQSFTILTASGGLSGTFSNAGGTVTGSNGVIYEISYVGNDVILTHAAPEIDVQGNSVTIVNGDITPALTDHTDFGAVPINSGTVVRTFTIANAGIGALLLTGTPRVQITGAAAADFTVTMQPTSPVGTNGSTTFQITFDPSNVGLRTATVSISSNDSDENPYTFAIQGGGAIQLTNRQSFLFIDEDLDQYRVTFQGSGSATITLDDADADGRGPIKDIVFAGTNAKTGIIRVIPQFAVSSGDQAISIGSISGTAVSQILAPYSDLIGTGTPINLPQAPKALQLRDVLNAGDIVFGGTVPTATSMKVRHIGANTDIQMGTSSLTLQATSVANDVAITGTSIRKLSVTSDFNADMNLSGGLLAAKIGGNVTDAVWSILGKSGAISIAGNVNNVAMDFGTTVKGLRAATFTNSHLYAGTSDGNTFTVGSSIGSFVVTGASNAFATSVVAADRIGKVTLASVNTSTLTEIRAKTSIKRVTVLSPSFVISNVTADGDNNPFGNFHVVNVA